jgi:hypothetical protein
MDDSTEFTPKELFQISLYKEPGVLFSKSLKRALSYILPSVGLVAYSLVTDEAGYGLVGYGILLFQAIYRLILMKRAAGATGTIIRKYEAKIQKLQSGA